MAESFHTPTRKRPARKLMTEVSLEESADEVEHLLKLPLSPTTIQTLQDLHVDIEELQKMNTRNSSYKRRLRDVMRSESYTKRILNKDAKYAILAAKHKESEEAKMIIELGDYHRGNLNHLKIVAKEMIKEEFAEEKRNCSTAEERRAVTIAPNPLEQGKPWSKILDILEQESQEYTKWSSASQAAIKANAEFTTPKPDRPLTKFLAIAGQRCTRMMTLKQVRFEMAQDAVRNDLAHNGLDEIIEDAKADKDANSEHWKTLAQDILRKRKEINDGYIPHSLRGHESQIEESLLIYQSIYFKSLVPDEDARDVWQPSKLVMSDRHQPPPPDVVEEDIKSEVEAFVPADRWEGGKKEDYLNAYAEVNKFKAEITILGKEISDSGELKKNAQRLLSKAHKKLNLARSSFKAVQGILAKQEVDEDEEMDG